MARPKTKTTSESVSAYIKKTYHRIEVKVPKAKSEAFRKKCESDGTNPNRLINKWIAEYLIS